MSKLDRCFAWVLVSLPGFIVGVFVSGYAFIGVLEEAVAEFEKTHICRPIDGN